MTARCQGHTGGDHRSKREPVEAAVNSEANRWITSLVYNAATSTKVVRQSVSLPTETARQVRGIAKKRRLSANRVIVELVEEGIKARDRRRREFLELTQRFRSATDPKDVARLGDELGGMIFGE